MYLFFCTAQLSTEYRVDFFVNGTSQIQPKTSYIYVLHTMNHSTYYYALKMNCFNITIELFMFRAVMISYALTAVPLAQLDDMHCFFVLCNNLTA